MRRHYLNRVPVRIRLLPQAMFRGRRVSRQTVGSTVPNGITLKEGVT